MEEVKNQEMTEKQKTIGAMLIVGGAYILGCILGGSKARRENVEAYRRGVYDTLDAIILRTEK